MKSAVLATVAFLLAFLTVPRVWAQDRPPEVRDALEAVADRKAACVDKYSGADVGVLAVDDLCEYIAWEPLARRWPDTATRALEAEGRANALAGRLTECRHQVDRLEARGEQLSERVGQIGKRPTKLRAAAWGVGTGVVALGLGVVVGMVVD